MDIAVRKHARYDWQPSEHGGYDLEVEDELSMTINPSLGGQWRIYGYSGRNSISESNVESLPDAFYQAEQFVGLVVRDKDKVELRQKALLDLVDWKCAKKTAALARLARRRVA